MLGMFAVHVVHLIVDIISSSGWLGVYIYVCVCVCVCVFVQHVLFLPMPCRKYARTRQGLFVLVSIATLTLCIYVNSVAGRCINWVIRIV